MPRFTDRSSWVAADAGLAGLAFWSSAGLVEAQPMDTYGMGSRSAALAGAVTADVEDFSATYYNPAGIVRSGQVRVGVGWFGAGHELSLDGVNSNVDPVTGIVLGFLVPGQIDGFRFGFGLGVHLNDQRVSRSRTLPRARPRWELYDNRPHRTYLAAHVAVQPVDWLRLAVGIGFQSTNDNTLNIRGGLDITAPERLSRLEHDLNGELLTIRYPIAGVQVQPLEWLNFGFSYRGEFALSSELVAGVGECVSRRPDGSCATPGSTTPDAVNIGVGAGVPPIPGFLSLATASVNAYSPHQMNFSASIEPIPNTFRIGVELTWLLWSLYQSPIGSSEIELVINVPPELADTIMVPDTIVNGVPIPAGFSDRVVPRIGVEYTVVRSPDVVFDLRAGYFYENSPAPEQTGYTNLVDTDRHAWSLGFGADLLGLRPTLPGSLSIDGHIQYGYLPARTMTKTSPIDPVGDYTAEGHIIVGSVTVEARFE